MDKWKKAVVHLECATDSLNRKDREAMQTQIINARRQGQITEDQFNEEFYKLSKDARFHGTAVFFLHNEKYYLITARHVLWDEIGAKHRYDEIVEYAIQKRDYPIPPQFEADKAQIQARAELDFPKDLERAREEVSNMIFNLIFRVPSLDEVMQSEDINRREFLMNLGAGPYELRPYTFSTPELDLAVVSFNNSRQMSGFAQELLKLGYEPIKKDDIHQEPTDEGAEVYSVGFPATSRLPYSLNLNQDQRLWSSESISLPLFTFGRVAMLHKTLHYFWADMSIYGGNSGGPVIEGDKLVGIVSEQSVIPVEGNNNLKVRIPFGKIIKAKYIFDLIDEQERKIKARHDLMQFAKQQYRKQEQ